MKGQATHATVRGDANRRGKKVKSGCRTCKLRKVKCDENRPVCKRCLSTSRICDGYGIWGGGGNTYAQRYPILPTEEPCAPSPSISGNYPANLATKLEREHLAWFVCNSVRKFPGIFGSDFWHSLVIPATAAEPAVLHAVVALGSAHRKQSSLNGEEVFTLRQYSRSISHLRGLLDKGTDRTCVTLALITCILHTYLDYLRGHHHIAGTHLENGLKLLGELHTDTAPNHDGVRILKFSPNTMDTRIIEIFARLHVQADLFRQPNENISILLQPTHDEIPTPIFQNVEQARDSLDKLLHGLIFLTEKTKSSVTGYPKVPQIRIRGILNRWCRTFQTTMELPKTFPAQDFIAYRLLHMYYHMTDIMVTALYAGNESAYDSCTAAFETILTEAVNTSHLVDTENQSSQKLEMSDSIGDIGWIPPLYFTAIKCRDSRLRRQAIKLLKSRSHKEGIWDTKLVTIVAIKVLEIEENRFFDGLDIGAEITLYSLPGYVSNLPPFPEIYRFFDVQIVIEDGAHDQVKLICKRKGLDGYTDIFRYFWDGQQWSELVATGL